MSYLFAAARSCRSSGIGAQSLLFGSRKKAFLPGGLRSAQPRNLPRQSIPCLRTGTCRSVGESLARRSSGRVPLVAPRAGPECSLWARWRYRDVAYPAWVLFFFWVLKYYFDTRHNKPTTTPPLFL